MTRTSMILFAACIWATAGSMPASAGSPSFNCRYAQLPSEVAICKSDALGNLDSEMAGSYFNLVNDYTVPSQARRQIKNEQVSWLGARNRCGYSFGCLQSSYQDRIGRLSWWYAQFH